MKPLASDILAVAVFISASAVALWITKPVRATAEPNTSSIRWLDTLNRQSAWWVNLVQVRGCYYVVVEKGGFSGGIALIHCADCPNPIHQKEAR